MIIALFVLTFCYLLLIASFIIGFNKVDVFVATNEKPNNRFSIIVPFRNEAKNLESLIKSFDELTYPKHLFEVVLIDDNSTDDSQELALRLLNCTPLDFHIFNNNSTSESPKKDAITLAVNKSKYNWIITTDADCIVHKNWLTTLNDYLISHDVQMVVAPVILSNSNAIFDQFQTLEILSLQGATMAGFGLNYPLMCNGANFCYSKALFFALNGFEGNASIASGDDIFLMEKAIKENKSQVAYLKSKEAIVITKPEDTFSGMLQQRIRWAAKSTAYNSAFTKLIGLIILSMNAIIILGLLLTILGQIKWWFFLLIIVAKQLIDYLFLSKVALFFDREKVLNTYFFSSLIYPFVSVYVVLKAIFSTYQWKGRTFKK